jgi:hypothetical protein
LKTIIESFLVLGKTRQIFDIIFIKLKRKVNPQQKEVPTPEKV